MVALAARPRPARSTSRSAARGTARSSPTGSTCSQDCGAYPALGAFLPNLTALMSSGVYAIPKIEVEGRVGGHEHDADHRVPRRRPARRRHRRSSARSTSSRPRSAWIRPRCAAGTSSPRTRSRTRPRPARTYDSGDYEGALDLALARPATTSCAPSRSGAARRAARSSSASGSRAYVEITNPLDETEFGEVEITAGRRRDRPHRLVLARPGTRDDVRDDRRRAARAPAREGHGAQGRHGRRREGTGTYGSKSTQIGGTAARGAADDGRRAGEAARRRLPRGEPRRRRARHGARPLPRRRHAEPSLSWAELASRAAERRQARRAEGGARVPGAAPPSRSARTSPSSRSTPRPGRSSCSGSSASTTPAR